MLKVLNIHKIFISRISGIRNKGEAENKWINQSMKIEHQILFKNPHRRVKIDSSLRIRSEEYVL